MRLQVQCSPRKPHQDIKKEKKKESAMEMNWILDPGSKSTCSCKIICNVYFLSKSNSKSIFRSLIDMNFVAKEFFCQRSSLGSVEMKMSIYVLQNCRLQTAIPLGEFSSVKETVCFCFLRTLAHHKLPTFTNCKIIFKKNSKFEKV